MTRQELAQFDGREGQPAYVAINQSVYDVSESPMWEDGLHHGQHQAGQDLTEELKTAPHVRAVVERFPVVGKLEEDVAAPESTGSGRVVAVAVAAVILVLLGILLLR